MAKLLEGTPVATALSETLTQRVLHLHTQGIIPTLAILRVGERGDDLAYERGAMKRCKKVGIAVQNVVLPVNCTRERLMNAIRSINENSSIHGCLMFRPLPNKADEEDACALLAPEKDVDCITAGSLASVFTGRGNGYPPCTAQACMEILAYYGYDLTGKKVAVIGRSLVIGKPVSMMLQEKNATVTMCHTKTVEMEKICREADILVVAAGKAKVVTEDYCNSNQVVIDVGINVGPDGNLCGDVDFEAVKQMISAITPVPGGVGAVTSTVLAKHVIEAAERTLA